MKVSGDLTLTAMLLLAVAIFPGRVIPDTFTDGGDAYKRKDYTTAAAKFKEVATKGDHRAMYAMGSMYVGGAGVKQDYQEAFKWFAAAAKYGRPDAQYKIGLMYELGVGVKQNYRQAARYYQLTAEKGYAHGQFKLGQLYLHGNGIQTDLVKAFAWMFVARQNFMNAKSTAANPEPGQGADEPPSGDIFATIHLEIINAELDSLKLKLTAAQLADAQKLVQEYIQYR